MPEETFLTLGMFFVLEKHWTITAKENNDPPKEKKCEEVERHKSCDSIHIELTLTRWETAFVYRHAHKHLVAGKKSAEPEKGVDNEVSLQNSEKRA
jgi:hypothetical protein